MLGERLKSERERLGLSRAKLARPLEMGEQTVRNWERCDSAPNAVHLEKLLLLGLDVIYLLTGERLPETALDLHRAATRLTLELEPEGGPLTHYAPRALGANGSKIAEAGELYQTAQRRENRLLAQYRAADDAGQRRLEALAEQLAAD